MDEEIKTLLEANLKLSKENNNLLRKVRSSQRWSTFTRFFYWIIIIGAAFGSFYFLKPYIGNLLSIYSGSISSVNKVKDISDKLNIQNIKNTIDHINK